VTEYEYDIAGNLVKERGPDGAGGRPEASHAYDAAGQLIESTSPNGLRTTYAYDALGRLVSETAHKRDDASDPSSATTAHATSYAYDAVGNRTSITTPQGRTTRFEHNAAGELTAVWLPGRTAPTRFEYDFAGRLVREIDPSGRAVEHVFDGAGREIETTQVGTAGTRLTTRTEYDAAGNVTAVTDPRGTTTRYDVDAGNRVTRITQPVDEHHSIEVEIGYDAQGNATRVRNGEGVDTWYRYNAWGLLERVIEAPTQRHPALADRSWMFHYDAAGNPIRESSPGGAVITRGFDAHNREVLRETDDLDNFATFEYDLGGRLISTETGWDRIELTWDDLDRLTTSTTGQDTHRFRYDADGLLVGDDSANFLLGGTSFSRDDSGAVVTTENASARGNYAWHDTYDDATGVLLSRAMRTPNYELGSTEWTYDEFGRTRTITNTTGPGAPEQDISYEYDANGNVTSKASRNDVHPGGDYAYDLANRLTHWTPKAAGSYPHQFQWDKAGNRASESVGAWFYEWRYDDRNRLERAVFDNDHEVTSTPIEVDARGNITEIGDRRLEYDDFDQLISDSGQEYTYDSLGRLTSRGDAEFDYAGLAIDPVVASDGAGGEEYAVRDEGGGLLATAGHYVGAGTTTRLALLDAHTDHTGGTTASGTGGTFGTRQGSSAFDPFGNRLGGSAPLLTPNGKASVFGFQSDWTDPATGAVHMGARWYDPSLGTFLSRDSADLPLTSHGGINRYSYGDANPLSNYDPTGRSAATLTDIATDWIDEIEDFLRLEWQFGQPAARPHPGAHPPAVPTGAPTIAQGVARKTFFAVAGRLALRAVPVIGWATLVADAVAFSQLLRPVAPPTGTTRPTPIPRPTPTPAPPVEDAPVTWERTVSESYSNASQRTALTTEGGLRVLTTTWLADLYRETRVDYSNGAWTWTREFVGRYVTDELREVLGRVIDPERIDQTHHTPTLTSGQQTSVGTQAQIDSQCGLSGTLTSCLTPGPVVASGCTGWDAPSRVCTPQAAVPGAAGATGPSTPAGQNAGKAPSGAAGSAGGSGGSGGGGSLYAEEDCGPDPDADENSGIVYRRKDSNGGEDYVGQAKSPNHYGARQKAHSRANPDALYTFDIIGNRPPGVQLDRLEEYYIRQGGGPTNRGNPDGGLANRRHQMNDQRYLDAGGDPC
jgi:RHS repeat-associated protein